MPIETALIHTARVVRRGRAEERSPQGEYTETETEGTPFAARLMIAGSVQRATPQLGSAATQGDVAERIAARYEVLADAEDEDGNDLVILPTDRIQFTDGGPLGNPLLDVDGKPEMLNNGQEKIGWLLFGTLMEDA